MDEGDNITVQVTATVIRGGASVDATVEGTGPADALVELLGDVLAQVRRGGRPGVVPGSRELYVVEGLARWPDLRHGHDVGERRPVRWLARASSTAEAFGLANRDLEALRRSPYGDGPRDAWLDMALRIERPAVGTCADCGTRGPLTLRPGLPAGLVSRHAVCAGCAHEDNHGARDSEREDAEAAETVRDRLEHEEGESWSA